MIRLLDPINLPIPFDENSIQNKIPSYRVKFKSSALMNFQTFPGLEFVDDFYWISRPTSAFYYLENTIISKTLQLSKIKLGNLLSIYNIYLRLRILNDFVGSKPSLYHHQYDYSVYFCIDHVTSQ